MTAGHTINTTYRYQCVYLVHEHVHVQVDLDVYSYHRYHHNSYVYVYVYVDLDLPYKKGTVLSSSSSSNNSTNTGKLPIVVFQNTRHRRTYMSCTSTSCSAEYHAAMPCHTPSTPAARRPSAHACAQSFLPNQARQRRPVDRIVSTTSLSQWFVL